jgi:hypothetical protein
MKAHWTIVYWCADHAHGSGFFGLLFTLEPTKRVRESLKACDARPIFPQTTAVGIDMGPGHACSAETEGKSSPVFCAKLLASTLLLDTRVQRKTVRTCSSTCFSDSQAPCCDMAAPVCSSTVAVCAVLGWAVGCLGTVSLSVDLAPSSLHPPSTAAR